MRPLDERCAGIYHLAEATGIVGVSLYRQRLQVLRQPLAGMSHETVVVWSGHTDVHIVVPGDEALVAHGTQHGACPTVVSDAVLAAHTVDGQQNLEDVLM